MSLNIGSDEPGRKVRASGLREAGVRAYRLSQPETDMNREIALVRRVTCASVACAASLALALLAAPRAGAQGGDSAVSADSVRRSRGLAGSMRAALDLSASRNDGGPPPPASSSAS